MTKIFTKLLCAALLLLCAFNTRAQEIDSLYVDSTENEFSTVHMLDSVFKHVDLLQVPPNSRAFPNACVNSILCRYRNISARLKQVRIVFLVSLQIPDVLLKSLFSSTELRFAFSSILAYFE